MGSFIFHIRYSFIGYKYAVFIPLCNLHSLRFLTKKLIFVIYAIGALTFFIVSKFIHSFTELDTIFIIFINSYIYFHISDKFYILLYLFISIYDWSKSIRRCWNDLPLYFMHFLKNKLSHYIFFIYIKQLTLYYEKASCTSWYNDKFTMSSEK